MKGLTMHPARCSFLKSEKGHLLILGRSPHSTARQRVTVRCEARADVPHLQLATAKIPADVNLDSFAGSLYQWAATLTTNGRNMPFALPLRCDQLPRGFTIELLRVVDGDVLATAKLEATVEEVAGAVREGYLASLHD